MSLISAGSISLDSTFKEEEETERRKIREEERGREEELRATTCKDG